MPTITHRLRDLRGEESGFTLIEMMVVLFMASVLAAIAVPNIASARKDARDLQTSSDLRIMADALDLDATKGRLGNRYDIANLAPDAIKKSGNRGTVFHLESDGTDYCLTAHHEDGHRDASNPLVFDSTLGVRGDISRESTEACSTHLNGAAWMLDDRKELARLETEHASHLSVCGAITPGAHPATLTYAQATTDTGAVERVELIGQWKMSDSCSTVEYDLRVQNADPDTTYTVPVRSTFTRPGVHELGEETTVAEHGPLVNLTFAGTATINTIQTAADDGVPTGLKPESNATTLHLDSIKSDRFSGTSLAWNGGL